MPVMGMVGCKIFEDEIAHIIESDPSIDGVLVVENEDSAGLIRKLESVNQPYRMMPLEDIPSWLQGDGFFIVVNMLELALHAVPDDLKEHVYKIVEQMADFSDGLLLFYGLCGNVLGKVEEDFVSLPCTVHILKEDDGEVVDDCIGAVLGGRGAYLETLKSFNGVGAMLMTPMWADNWREMIKSANFTQDPDDIETTKMVFDYVGYKKVAKIDTGLDYVKDFDAKVDEFARLFDFEKEEIEGGQELIEKCYGRLKAQILE